MYHPNKDIYQNWDGDKLHFTIRTIFDICDIPIPEESEINFDREISRFFTSTATAKGLVNMPNSRCYVLIAARKTEYRNASVICDILAAGHMVISHVQDKRFAKYPHYIYVEDASLIWAKLGQYVLSMFEMPRVCITGSVGKSTTSLLTQHIFSNQGKTFFTRGNRNTFGPIVSDLIKRVSKDTAYFVQEVGGGEPALVERSARIFKPNYFCITNIWGHHLREYGSLNAILYDKASLDRLSESGAVGIINGDDTLLLNHEFKSKIVTCGIENTECDYVATDIKQQDNEFLSFSIQNRGNTYRIKVNLLGEYNAYNTMYAFAIAKEAGIPVDDIITSINSFRLTDRKRQFTQEVAGRKLIVDCFNVAADSIKEGAGILDKWVTPSGKKFAFLGAENRVGSTAPQVNYKLGTELAALKNITNFVIYGYKKGTPLRITDKVGDSYSLYKGLTDAASGCKVQYEHQLSAAVRILQEETHPGDVIYFKGHFNYPMWPIIDNAFGTNYYYESSLGTAKRIIRQGLCYAQLSFMNSLVITAAKQVDPQLIIPNELDGMSVHGIAQNAFMGKQLQNIDFGHTLKHIGNSCLEGVRDLKEVTLPASCLYIGAKAFADIQSLQTVVIHGAQTIDSCAFSRCSHLENVVFTSDCITIAADAFDGSHSVTIKAPAASHIEDFAKEHKIPFEAL